MKKNFEGIPTFKVFLVLTSADRVSTNKKHLEVSLQMTAKVKQRHPHIGCNWGYKDTLMEMTSGCRNGWVMAPTTRNGWSHDVGVSLLDALCPCAGWDNTKGLPRPGESWGRWCSCPPCWMPSQWNSLDVFSSQNSDFPAVEEWLDHWWYRGPVSQTFWSRIAIQTCV